MNIAIFTDCYYPIKNGVVAMVLQMEKELSKRGHKVYIITTKYPKQKYSKNVLAGWSLPVGLGTELRFGLFNQRKINNFVEKNKIEIIHSHTEFNIGSASHKSTKKFKIPHIHTFHTMWEDYTHYLKIPKFIMRFFLLHFLFYPNKILTPSKKSQLYLKSILPKSFNIEITPNSIDLEKFVKRNKSEIDNLKHKLGIKKDEKIGIFVGRMGKEKRVVELLEVIEKTLLITGNLKFILVGDGPEFNKLKKLIIKKNLEEKVILVGFVDWKNIIKYYSIADFYINISISETQSMTATEALAFGLPILVRKDDGYFGLVEDNKNGFLVEKDDELTLLIKKLVNDESLLSKFSKNSFKKAKDYSISKLVDRLEIIYKKSLDDYSKKI